MEWTVPLVAREGITGDGDQVVIGEVHVKDDSVTFTMTHPAWVRDIQENNEAEAFTIAIFEAIL